ncbi:MAG TPA: SDR family oxidoreductase [Anaerolineales bacterium]
MILVTGATGHIGNVLVQKLLRRGEKVRVLMLRGDDATHLQGLPLEFVEGDVLDVSSLFKALQGVRSVFHLAGLISIMPGQNPRLRSVNVEGTKNVLRAAVDAGVKKLVYTSSIHAIRRAIEGVIDETLPYDPANPYGEYDRSKAEATLQVQQAAAEGLGAVIVCPTGVIGPHDYRGSMLGNVIRTAAQQKPTLYVDGAYDFVDVRDVADGLIAAAERGRPGESYILSGHRISVRYLLETVREITGGHFFQMKVPFDLARLAARFTPGYYNLFRVSPRFTSYSLEVLRSNANISHAKATHELGYGPRAIYQTIADTVHWMLHGNVQETAQ